MASLDQGQQRRRKRPSPTPLFTLQYSTSVSESSSTYTSNAKPEGTKPRTEKDSAVSSVCFLGSSNSNGAKSDLLNNCNENRNFDESDASGSASSSSDSYISDDDCDADDDVNDLLSQLKCRTRLLACPPSISEEILQSSATSYAASLTFANNGSNNHLLASCHAGGDAWLWDLSSRRIASHLVSSSRSAGHSSPGMSITRFGSDGSTFLYQTRDANGTLTLHDLNTASTTTANSCAKDEDGCKVVSSYETNSCTFTAATSLSECNLIAMPCRHESFVRLVDVRANPYDRPVAVLHGAGLKDESASRKEGMLMSMSLCKDDGGRVVLGCGMESGSVFFHDLGMFGGEKSSYSPCHPATDCGHDSSMKFQRKTQNKSIDTSEKLPSFRSVTFTNLPNFCSIRISKDPILCLDMSPSPKDLKDSETMNERNKHSQIDTNQKVKRQSHSSSFVTIAGMAGDAADLLDRPPEERGTIALIKTTINDKQDANANDGNYKAGDINARLRGRVGTCRLSNTNSQMGKPGVGVCRFRPDGRVFAVGGWDRRVRIYGRSNATPLAILKGDHLDSVTSLDWAVPDVDEGRLNDDLANLGVLAAGSGDGKISIWRAFPTT